MMDAPVLPSAGYRGRIAPSPTGYLHLGHARTFWVAQERARAHRGVLVLRNEDLDLDRCRPEFVAAMLEDLAWFGFDWQEGPDRGGPTGPYEQSRRLAFYAKALARLQEKGVVYPCRCSRRDIQLALGAPQGTEEPIYPGTCRLLAPERLSAGPGPDAQVNWRFRVPDGQAVTFHDLAAGPQSFVAGKDFGDFVVWRQDGVPAYQLAVVVDDATMRITEVVRGADLLLSTARQWLLYRALGWEPPQFMHCELVTDDAGNRLAKRHAALSLRELRANGLAPAAIRASPAFQRTSPFPKRHRPATEL
ncbi:MAG TPA: tRNA glutamyl-Q(34) synthetase GluQRS [Candidatus Dormibacteraeota bacterium]|nr:tRNA glutamyl-Q(34) synthetase GluQRS [Candidatus Dormibacteraeota bacterium]